VTKGLTRRAAPLPPGERRAAIIAAITPLIREHGAGVTTQQIARAAGIAEGTIFRVFPDKDSLVVAVVDAAFDTGSLVARIADIADGGTLDRRLTEAVEVLQEYLSGVFTLIGAVGLRPPQGGDRGPVRHEESHRLLTAALVALLEPHTDELARPPAEVAEVLRLMTFSATHPRVVGGPPLAAAEVVSLVLDGVRDHTRRRMP